MKLIKAVFLTAAGFALAILPAVPAAGWQLAPDKPDKTAASSQALAPQPIPFSHKTHAERKLTCDVCHTNPDPGDKMAIADTDTCMACHQSVAADKPAIQKLAQFAQSSKPVPWVRIYSVPAFVYWSHRTHLQADLKCEMCHGDVAQMSTMTKVGNVTTMAGCVDCHKKRNASTGCSACHEGASAMLLPLK